MKILFNNKTYILVWHHVNNVEHEMVRLGLKPRKLTQEVYAKESYTDCFFKELDTKETVWYTRAIMGKKEKHFNKDKGRRVTLRKLFNHFDYTKEQKKEIWKDYFIHTNQLHLLNKMDKNK